MGVVSTLVLPVAFTVTRWVEAFEAIHAGVGVPVALGFGWWANHSTSRRSRLLGAIGIGLGLVGAIALATFAVLTLLGA